MPASSGLRSHSTAGRCRRVNTGDQMEQGGRSDSPALAPDPSSVGGSSSGGSSSGGSGSGGSGDGASTGTVTSDHLAGPEAPAEPESSRALIPETPVGTIAHSLPTQRVMVATAGVLIGLSTALPTFATSFSSSNPLASGSSHTITFWDVHGTWIVCPILLVMISVGCLFRTLTSMLHRVNYDGMLFGLMGAVVLGVECYKVKLFVTTGHVRYFPALGSALTFVACFSLLAWPTIWSNAILRQTRRALGGHLTAEGGWVDPKLTWLEVHEGSASALGSTARRAPLHRTPSRPSARWFPSHPLLRAPGRMTGPRPQKVPWRGRT